ncbi:MAG: hypothetical protein II117_00005, partial [Clostridia bacterium]|nr:hypothetical protein [Clostridia bacterium]
MRPRYRDIWVSMGAITLMLIPAFFLNEAFPGSDYLFLRLDMPVFPKNQYLRAGIYAVLLILVFHAMWFAYAALRKRSAKTTKENEQPL